MRKIFLSIPFILSGCVTTESNVDKGLCLKYVTYMQERQECVGGRGVAPQVCVVEYVPRTSCVRWEWPKGRPEESHEKDTTFYFFSGVHSSRKG